MFCAPSRPKVEAKKTKNKMTCRVSQPIACSTSNYIIKSLGISQLVHSFSSVQFILVQFILVQFMLFAFINYSTKLHVIIIHLAGSPGSYFAYLKDCLKKRVRD